MHGNLTTRFLDEVGRLTDPEVLRVAGLARRRRQDRSVEAARADARRIIKANGREEMLDELSQALRQWAAYSGAVGELAADLSMRQRVEAHPLLADALLAFVAGTELDTMSRDTLVADWVSARPGRFGPNPGR